VLRKWSNFGWEETVVKEKCFVFWHNSDCATYKDMERETIDRGFIMNDRNKFGLEG
jgi:hypothetical protein